MCLHINFVWGVKSVVNKLIVNDYCRLPCDTSLYSAIYIVSTCLCRCMALHLREALHNGTTIDFTRLKLAGIWLWPHTYYVVIYVYPVILMYMKTTYCVRIHNRSLYMSRYKGNPIHVCIISRDCLHTQWPEHRTVAYKLCIHKLK